MSALLQRTLLERILQRPGARAVPYSPGEAISRFRDDAELAEEAISWTLDAIGRGLFAIIAVAILLTISAKITLLVFFPLVGVVAIAQAISKRLEKYRTASRLATGNVTSAIGEIFETVQAIKVAKRATFVRHQPIYLTKAVPELLSRGKGETYPDNKLETLEASELAYRYPDTGRGIEGISLRLKRGSLTVVTGRIGSGKTTLLRVLLGLFPKDAGEIRWNGHAVVEPATFFLPPPCAYTGQVPQLFSDTLKENILLGLSEENVDLQAAIHMAVMEQDVAELENGLLTVIGSRGG